MADNDLNDVVEEVIDDASVITVPIDDTLSISGEAADAKAVGDALDLKADKSELQNAVTVNGQEADNQGHIIVTGEDIDVSESDTTSVKDKLAAIDGKTAADIPVSSAAGAKKVATVLNELDGKTAADIPMSSTSGAQTIAQKIATQDTIEEQNSTDIAALKTKAGDTIKIATDDTRTIQQAVNERVLTVNGTGADSNGNVNVEKALFADNLTTKMSQTSTDEFIRRTSGGDASISDGDAWLQVLRGNRYKYGYIPESLSMSVIPVPREEGQEEIYASIDRDTFVEYVSESGTINLYYTVEWSADPELYGVTIEGTPLAGDQITITYVKEDRGTITQSNPQTLVSTGWNLYDHTAGYAVGLKYSTTYGFRIDGAYTAVKYSATLTSDKSTITPDENGLFTIPASGYIWVEGGNSTTTAVYMTWSDWINGHDGDWAAYSESVVDFSNVMTNCFPYGLLRVGDIRDEINFTAGTATSNVERLAYNATNLAAAQASGRVYEFDTNYIYLERETAVVTEITVSGDYTASDHGLEMYTGTTLAVYSVLLYGNNLKNKLERDVVQISTQTLTAAQKTSARSNIGAASAADLDETNDAIARLQTADTVLQRHTRLTDFSLTDLQSAVSDQNLEKYGLKPGDYKTINGYDYVIAGLGVMRGTHDYTCKYNHVGLIVIPHTTCKWNASGRTDYTSTDSDNRGGGYKNCDLHKYLVDTVLPHVQNDLGSSHLYQHKKLLSNAVNATGYNRFGTNSGCASGWEWVDCYISALTEAQVFGGDHWSSSGYDTGEANTLLPVFAAYKHTEIFKGEYPWLRNVSSASQACDAGDIGDASGVCGVGDALCVAGLILYH